MALIIPVKGISPVFGPNCWLAPNASVIGDVIMGNACTVWFNAVVRGDVNSIRIGSEVNIQDGAIIHCTYQKASVTIGDKVSIAHNAIVHGCTLENEILVGMGAIVMDYVQVQSRVIIAAGAVVAQNSVLESGWIYAGTPAKKLKPIDEVIGEVFERTAKNYQTYAEWFKEAGY